MAVPIQSARPHVVVVGAGIGGLVAALILAEAGLGVTVVEKEPTTGGKLRRIEVAGRMVDSGPTVLTLRGVFDDLLASVGERLDEHLTLVPSPVIARHFWPDGGQLDLFVDTDRSAAAIAAFAGSREAAAYRRFQDATAEVFATLDAPFIDAGRPSLPRLIAASGLRGLPALARIRAFSSLWTVIRGHFHDPRLRQLFARYATYCGASPFAAPGPLMLVAHVEQSGVWLAPEGMHAVARMLEALARARGAVFLLGCPAERILTEAGRTRAVVTGHGDRLACEAVVFNGDPSALAAGLLGEDAQTVLLAIGPEERSLSAVTLSMVGRAPGRALAHHNVFFSADYRAEFDAIFNDRRIPLDPTIYLCAQDRAIGRDPPAGAPERLFSIVNAPADGDRGRPDQREVEQCARTTLARMAAGGIDIRPEHAVTTSPTAFNRLFPATGGALYGRASHGWMASFRRPQTRTAIPGLFLAGGAVHPGPGLPMAALSGRNAARAIIRDLGSTRPSRQAAMRGGMSTR